MSTIKRIFAGTGIVGVILFILALIALVPAFFIGYGMNIYALTQCDFEAPYRAEIVRGIGIPVPIVGAIAGYYEIEDGVQQADLTDAGNCENGVCVVE